MRSLPIADIQRFVHERFPKFGLNKQKEIVRLLAEIAGRDRCGFDAILQDHHYEQKDFLSIKTFLLKKRFPRLTAAERASVTYLPCDFLKLEQPIKEAPDQDTPFQPKNIYVEKSVSGCGLAKRFSEFFPEARVSEIDRYKDFVSRQPEFGLHDYNQRLDNVFIIREQFDFFQECPCSAGASSCGYHIMNAGSVADMIVNIAFCRATRTRRGSFFREIWMSSFHGSVIITVPECGWARASSRIH